MQSFKNLGKTIKHLTPVGILYVGRVGIAGLGLIILPWLSRVLPPEEFGLAATVLSLQSLAVVLDLGLSVVVSRELPGIDSQSSRLAVVSRSERTLFILYCWIMVAALILSAANFIPVPITTTLLIGLSMLLVVWQNIIVIAFISQQNFLTSTITQFAALLLRLGTGLGLVILSSSTLQMFVLGQVAGSICVVLLSRQILFRRNETGGEEIKAVQSSLSSNLAIMIYTIAGACALQVDKLLLSSFASPAYTGSYFLASIFSLVPITFLASPLSQFVQPKLIASLVQHRDDEAQLWIARATAGILILAVLPGIALGLSANLIVPLWLQGSSHQADVIRYVTLLMPGASVGALGLVPAIVLMTRRDYVALAIISCLLTIAVLVATAVLADRNSIDGICLAYSAYHTMAALSLWVRARQIEPRFAISFGIFFRGARGRA